MIISVEAIMKKMSTPRRTGVRLSLGPRSCGGPCPGGGPCPLISKGQRGSVIDAGPDFLTVLQRNRMVLVYCQKVLLVRQQSLSREEEQGVRWYVGKRHQETRAKNSWSWVQGQAGLLWGSSLSGRLTNGRVIVSQLSLRVYTTQPMMMNLAAYLFTIGQMTTKSETLITGRELSVDAPTQNVWIAPQVRRE